MRIVPLSRSEHRTLRIDPQQAQAAAAGVHLVPLTKSELRRASRSFPLVFIKHAETGRFRPAALLGLAPGENLFWTGDSFAADHVPLNLQRLPFYAGGDEPGGGAICIDLDSAAIAPTGSLTIVEPDGSDSAYIRGIQAILQELASQQEPTDAFVQQALALGLLAEIRLDIVLDNGEQIDIAGLYGIDDQALERSRAQVASFEDSLLLMAMLLSLDHVAGLVARKNERAGDLAAWHRPAGAL